MELVITPRDLMKHARFIRKNWKCIQCGFCCTLKFGIKRDDWERWKDVVVKSKLEDIHPMRKFCNLDSVKYSKLGDLSFHPETGEEFKECPFGYIRDGKHFCYINDPKIKPNNCKDFNERILDLRCRSLRKMIKIMFELKFTNKEEEESFFTKLNDEFKKVQLTNSLYDDKLTYHDNTFLTP